MRRLIPLVVLAALLAACGSSRPVASVDGTELEQEEFLDRLEARSGGRAASYGTDVASAVAQDFVAATLAANELERRGIDPASFDDQFVVDVGFQGSPPEDDATFENTRNIVALAYELAELDPPDEERLRDVYEQSPGEYATGYCSQVLVLPDEATAEEALAELEDGAAFETVLDDHTSDPAAPVGADIGCVAPGTVVAEIEQYLLIIEAGEWAGPYPTQLGYLVARTSDRAIPPFEEVTSQVRQQVAGNDFELLRAAFQAWYPEALEAADVELDDRYFADDRDSFFATPNGVFEPALADTAPPPTTAP